MFIFLKLLQISRARELEETSTYSVSGDLEKLYSAYEKVYLPKKPLNSISIEISLQTYKADVDEYTDPSPMAYIGLDSNPEYFSYASLNLSSRYAYLSLSSLPVSDFLIIRIDGGLFDSFTVTPGYGIPEWVYSITVNWTYCYSGFFTSSPSSPGVCDVPIIQAGDLSSGQFAAVLTVPPGTQKLTLLGSGLLASPATFAFTGLPSDNITVEWPATGDWYLTGSQGFSYELEECSWDAAGLMWCNGQIVKVLNSVPHYALPPKNPQFQTYGADVLVFRVPASNIKYMYRLELSPADTVFSLGYRSPAAQTDTQLPYLRQGEHYISLASRDCKVSFYQTTMDPSFCHGEEYELTDGLIYTCDCSQHLTGRHCQDKSMPDHEYYRGLLFLTFSNLSMLPAIVAGVYLRYYGESFIFAANMVASIVYHLCDYHYYCALPGYRFLRTLDFILSYLSVLIIFVVMLKIHKKEHKLLVFCLLFVLVLYIGTGSGFEGFMMELFVSYM